MHIFVVVFSSPAFTRHSLTQDYAAGSSLYWLQGSEKASSKVITCRVISHSEETSCFLSQSGTRKKKTTISSFPECISLNSFRRAWHWLQVSLCFASVACFRAVATGCLFLHQLLVFPCLALVALLSSDWFITLFSFVVIAQK